MASFDFMVTATPTAIPDLEADTRYSIQNSGGDQPGDEALRVAIKASAADVDPAGGFILLLSQTAPVSRTAAEQVYVWHLPGRDFLATLDTEAV